MFLFRVAEGTADGSFGHQVAAASGIHMSVVRRAEEVMKALKVRGRKGTTQVPFTWKNTFHWTYFNFVFISLKLKPNKIFSFQYATIAKTEELDIKPFIYTMMWHISVILCWIFTRHFSDLSTRRIISKKFEFHYVSTLLEEICKCALGACRTDGHVGRGSVGRPATRWIDDLFVGCGNLLYASTASLAVVTIFGTDLCPAINAVQLKW